MKIKTAELTGFALAWAVFRLETADARTAKKIYEAMSAFFPAVDWSQGGPIIERERISVEAVEDEETENWRAYLDWRTDEALQDGPTPLIAAMRCYVASKLGDEVDVPDELM